MDYRLPDTLRPALAAPFGPIHDSGEAVRKVKGRLVIAVGDVVTQTFLDAGVVPKLMVIDGHTQRGAVGIAGAAPRRRSGQGGVVEDALAGLPDHGVRFVEVANPPAAVTGALIAAMDRALKTSGSTLIHVTGEEDLAALPAMILAPIGAAVCYGQPNRGVVIVVVTPTVRERAQNILQQMEVK